MQILIIAPTPFFADRGTHIRILEEALALEKLGHTIQIATYHIGRDIDTEVKTKIDVRRIHRLLFWYKKLEAGPDWQKIILDLMLIRKAFYLARKYNPDIIHGHLHEGVIIGWIVKKMIFWKKIKLVADFHGSLTKEMVSHDYLKGGILKSFFGMLEKIIDNMGDYALSSSGENSEEILEYRKDKKIKTVLDGVNLDYYQKLPSKEESKRELEIPEGKIVAVYTGALVPNKGTQYLFEAIKIVLQENNNIFFIIGGFPIEDAEDFVKKNNFAHNVRLIHPLNYFDLPKILNASDIGIDPKDSSVRQASGKILQYMAAGLAIACFDRKNNREYLDSGAEYANEVSGKGLADAIFNLTKNPEEIIRKGLISKKRSGLFSWEKSAKDIDEIYKIIYDKKYSL